MTKDLTQLKDVEVHTIRGATPETVLSYLQSKVSFLLNQLRPEVIIIHVGTNYLGTKDEWSLYLNLVKGKLSETNYKEFIKCQNPLPANGTALHFRDTFQRIIDTIRINNHDVTILISAIIPRPWDHERRNNVRIIYNGILQNLNSQRGVFYIPTYRPFLDRNKNPLTECFLPDGLHLTTRGSEQLRSFFYDKIDKACKKTLK